MVGCAVYSCKRRSENSNFSKDGVSYHTFPKDPLLRKEWIAFCHKQDSTWRPRKTSVICSDHFDDCCFLALSLYNKRRKLRENSKPTLLLCECKKILSRRKDDRFSISQSAMKQASSESQSSTLPNPMLCLEISMATPESTSSQPKPYSSAPQLLLFSLSMSRSCNPLVI